MPAAKGSARTPLGPILSQTTESKISTNEAFEQRLNSKSNVQRFSFFVNCLEFQQLIPTEICKKVKRFQNLNSIIVGIGFGVAGGMVYEL